MVRYIVVAIVACLYATGAIWLVGSQGRAYRERLASARGGEASRTIEEVAKAAPVATTPEPASTRPDPATKEPLAVAVESPPVKPNVESSVPASGVTSLAGAGPRPATSPPADHPTKAIASEVAGPAAPAPVVDAVWELPSVKMTWDLANLSAREETRLGAELRDLILRFNRRVETGEWQRRAEEAAEPFLEARSRKDIEYTFTILDSDEVNAFSTPGGFIYLSRGLFDLIGEDEDYALEFVVGHEIAHVDSQHAIRVLRYPAVMKRTEGTLQKLYLLILPFAYPDPLEFEADTWAYSRMRHHDRTDRESLAFLGKLVAYAKSRDFDSGRGKPRPDFSPIENHFRAHTAARTRLKRLKEFIAKAGGAPK